MANRAKPLSLPKELPLLPVGTKPRLSEDETALLKLIASGIGINEAERQMGWKHPRAIKVMKRPHVAKAMDDIQQAALDVTKQEITAVLKLSLESCDSRLAEVVDSGSDPIRGFTDRLKAIDIAYKRLRVYQPEHPMTPAMMQQINGPAVFYQASWVKPPQPQGTPKEEPETIHAETATR